MAFASWTTAEGWEPNGAVKATTAITAKMTTTRYSTIPWPQTQRLRNIFLGMGHPGEENE